MIFITILFLLLSVIFLISILILILYPKLYGYYVKIFFIRKYRETQILSALLINIWSFSAYDSMEYLMQGYFRDFMLSSIAPILQENHPAEGVLCHQQIIERYCINVNQRSNSHLAVSLALLDKLIMETNIETIPIADIFQNYKRLLLLYKIEGFPLIPNVHVTEASVDQIKNFMLTYISNSMTHMQEPYSLCLISPSGINVYQEHIPEDILKSYRAYQEFYNYLTSYRFKIKEIIAFLIRFFGFIDMYKIHIKPVAPTLYLPDAQIDIPMLPSLNQIPSSIPPNQPAPADGSISPGRTTYYEDGHWYPTKYGRDLDHATKRSITYYAPLIILGATALALGALKVYIENHM